MKIITPALFSLCFILAARAQDSAPSPSVPSAAETATSQRAPATLDTLLGPIALYPDPLVALILPAATTPSDIVLAARYLDAKNDPAAVDGQPWSESVKALVHYPDVLKWMNDNLEWTQALGQAFLDQPADVMNSVQRLRVRAKASGALVSTPQQQVLDQGGQIVIQPVQPDIVYVPVYDPNVVYMESSSWGGGPSITFGFGYPIGPWFTYDCDWGRRTVWVISRPADWRQHPRYWENRGPRQQKPPGQPWRPPVNNHPRPSRPVYAHPATPRPIHVNPASTQQPPRPTPHPRDTTITTIPGAPSQPSVRPPYNNNSREKNRPVSPNISVTVPTPAPAPNVQPPTVVKPPMFTRPTRPANPDNIDRSHHPGVPPPSVHLAPVAPPPVPAPAPADADPRKARQGP